eukprot:s4336_g2.t1
MISFNGLSGKEARPLQSGLKYCRLQPLENIEIVRWQQDRSTFHTLQDSGNWIGQGHKFSVARGQRLTRQ